MSDQKAEVLNIEQRRKVLMDLESNRNKVQAEMNDIKNIKTQIKDTKQSLGIAINEKEIIINCRAQQIILYDGEACALLEELKILYP